MYTMHTSKHKYKHAYTNIYAIPCVNGCMHILNNNNNNGSF